MDLGIFLSNKKRVICWILCPILLLCILFSFFSIYFSSINDSLKEREAIVKLIPVISRKVSMADEILRKDKRLSSDDDVIEDLNLRLNRMAQSADFTINSLAIEKNAKRSAKGISVFEVEIKGDGSLVSIGDFFNAAQTPERPFVVETAGMKSITSDAEPRYNVSLILLYHNM